MKSKISCFNRMIYKKNLTRFWPFALLYAIYLILAHPLVVYLEIEAARMDTYGQRELWTVVGDHYMSMTEPISVFLISMVMAIAVFSYLYQSRSANMIHAFPVTRTELFVSNYLSGLTLLVVPQLLAAFTTNLVILGDANKMTWAVWTWFGMTMGETIFFYSLACLIAMFTGQLLAAGLFYMIWNFLYLVSVALINSVAALFIYGCDGNLIPIDSHPLWPMMYLFREVGFQLDATTEVYSVKGISTLLIYLGIGLIFAVAACLIYQKRRLECAGDFLSMGWTKPIFRWGTAIIGGVGCAIFVICLFDRYNSYYQMAVKFVVFLVIFGIALFFVAQMFIEKSFRVFRRKLAVESVSCAAVLMIGVALLQFDVFGIESYVPEVSEVEAVALSGNGLSCFSEESDIEKAEQLHRMLISISDEQKKSRDAVDETTIYEYIRFTYYLENGKDVSRSYQVRSKDVDFMKALLKLCVELYGDPEGIKNSYFGTNYEELDWQVSGATLEYAKQLEENERGVYSGYSLYGSKEAMQQLYEAILADMDAGAFAELTEEMVDAIGRPAESVVVEEKGDTTTVVIAETVDEQVYLDATLLLELHTDRSPTEVDLYGEGRRSTVGRSVSGSDMSVWLRLNLQCTHTIQALIDLGEIQSVNDLIMK